MKTNMKKKLMACICVSVLLSTPTAGAFNNTTNDFAASKVSYTQPLSQMQISPEVIAMLSKHVAEAIQESEDHAQIDTSEKSEKITVEEMEQMSIAELESEIKVQQEIMDNAHEMAESARLLGLADDSNSIQTANAFYIDAQKSLKELQSELEERKTPPVFTFDIYTKSNLSVEDYESILDETPLAGHGQDFYDMEQIWGVNGLFALAVAQGESGTGANGILATQRNNFFGIQNHSFSSAREGILFFGELLNEPLYKGKDMDTVARSYCPPTWEEWAVQKRVIMRTYWKKLGYSF